MTLPNTTPDGCCETCHHPAAECDCPECPVCHMVGDPECLTVHGLEGRLLFDALRLAVRQMQDWNEHVRRTFGPTDVRNWTPTLWRRFQAVEHDVRSLLGEVDECLSRFDRRGK